MKIGIVFEGGGGKCAYQIGVWKAIKEYGIDKFVTSVSGTSAGALNAALFYQGDYYLAESLWQNIHEEDILHTEQYDSVQFGDAIFSQKKLGELIDTVLSNHRINSVTDSCYVTCRYRDKSKYRYFLWSDFLDLEMKKRILIASSAIPIIFESIEIDGEWYVDGGANGDNTPVKPLLDEDLDVIIVIHLSNSSVGRHHFSGKMIEIFPSSNIGKFFDGTLDFHHESINHRLKLGYYDGMQQLIELADLCFLESTKGSTKERNFLYNFRNARNNKKINTKKMEEEKMIEFNFTNEEARKEYEDKLSYLRKIVEKESVNSEYLWDSTVQKLSKKIEKVNAILQQEGISDLVTRKMSKDISNFLKKCKDGEFHIALVGAIKAGKSTLINALLDYEYASTQVTPETAALTKFKKGSENYIKLSFYNNDEWNALWTSANEAKATIFLEEYEKLEADNEKLKWLGKEDKKIDYETKDDLVRAIKEWTSSKSKCHYFVKEVEVGLKELELPEGVVLVDTPGLDDVVEYRSNITRDYIDRANAVLVCVKSDALTGQEMASIYSVFANARNNPGKVYVIATQIDTLNRPVENWEQQRQEWLKYLKGSGAYASLNLATDKLVPVSGYLYTLLKQYNDFDKEDDKYWDLESILSKFKVRNCDINEKYEYLLDFTNISKLKNKLEREIISEHKKILIDDIVESYELCKESIKETMEKVRASQEEIIEASKNGIEEIKKKQEEYNVKYKEAEEDKKELDILLKKLKLATTKRAEELEKAIKNLA